MAGLLSVLHIGGNIKQFVLKGSIKFLRYKNEIEISSILLKMYIKE